MQEVAVRKHAKILILTNLSWYAKTTSGFEATPNMSHCCQRKFPCCMQQGRRNSIPQPQFNFYSFQQLNAFDF